jgi:hypothetical protein
VSHTEPNPNRWKALGVCLVAGLATLLDVGLAVVIAGPVLVWLAVHAEPGRSVALYT